MYEAAAAPDHQELAIWRPASRRLFVWDGVVKAVFVDMARLSHRATLRVVNGSTLVAVFKDSKILSIDGNATWSFVWGDFTLYRNGEPEVTSFMLMRGPDGHLNPNAVASYLRYFRTAK